MEGERVHIELIKVERERAHNKVETERERAHKVETEREQAHINLIKS